MRSALRVLFAGLTLALGLTAQTTTSSIAGSVHDRTGAVIAGVQVTASNPETGLTRTAKTGADGRFLLPALPLGTYEVRAELSSFRPLVQKNVHVVVGETAVLELAMEVGPLDQALTVVGQQALVNTQSHELSYLVSEAAIRDLPLNGRNYTDLALLQPGVVSYPYRDGGSVVAHGLGASINGQDPRSNVYLIDGTPQNDFTNGPASSAAGTALGTETIREFRVEANNYSAEFGRNSGGQINVVTKSGSNHLHGSLFEFLRNDNFDARNFFDTARKPEFRRNQFGGTAGGPIARDRTFFFFGYEALRERLGRTIQTFVPDENARRGVLPDGSVTVNSAVRPYLDAFPLPNGPNIGSGIAAYSFGFNQSLDQDFLQGRVDHSFTPRDQVFGRYTFDDAGQRLPTDYPQFPRSFLSRNHFVTLEYRRIQSAQTLHTARVGFSRTRVGQEVESLASLPPFVPSRGMVGDIDIGGLRRFGPQSSVNVKLVQNVLGFEHGVIHTRGRHILKAGALAEHYQDNLFNPTFALGIYTFGGLRQFLLNQPARYLGLTPEGALDRYWCFTLFGFYVQDKVRIGRRLNVEAGLRYEFSTRPVDIYGRDSALINLRTDATPTVGPLYQNPTYRNISPRLGFAWDPTGNGKTSVRGGYGIFFNTNNQQNLIVTITNPPATPRISITQNVVFPNPPFERGLGNTMRPVQWDLKNPNVHMWNLNIQRQLWWETVVTLGYAGARGIHLLRSSDINTPVPTRLEDGTIFFPANAPRQNRAFTTIELKSSDGNSWYNSMVFEVRRRWSRGFTFQSSYTFARNIDTTQASTFFSDATNGTTSAMPEYAGFSYNKGLADYHVKHNWVVNATWDLPLARGLQGVPRAILSGWQVSGISQMRSGNPLTVFVQSNRSRSQWAPSLGPGLGPDRPSMAPGRTHESAIIGSPDRWFDPSAFALQPAGKLGNLGRGALIGPDLRNFDFAAVKNVRLMSLQEGAALQIRLEAFNLFNRTNFGPPNLLAFSGAPAAPDNEAPLPSLGRILNTVTSSRQIQIGLRFVF